MHLVKRIEIIASTIELEKLLTGLEQAGVPGYSVIRNVTGKSASGTVSDDLAITMMDNVYVIAFCPPEQIKSVVETIRPILNKFGGSCFISDAMEVRSLRCVASL